MRMPSSHSIINSGLIVYLIGNVATFVKLTFFDGAVYNWWNWIVLLPLNEALGSIWPVYWLLVRWVFH
jgi:hypothetical protein